LGSGLRANYKSTLRTLQRNYRIQVQRAECEQRKLQSTEVPSTEYRYENYRVQSTEYRITEYRYRGTGTGTEFRYRYRLRVQVQITGVSTECRVQRTEEQGSYLAWDAVQWVFVWSTTWPYACLWGGVHGIWTYPVPGSDLISPKRPAGLSSVRPLGL
jgi:hypothetical protein